MTDMTRQPGPTPETWQGGARTPEEIEREIEQTRARMTRDIDSLGHKLSPENLKDQAQAALEGARQSLTETARGLGDGASDRARRMGQSTLETVRRHPLPFAMMGAGVAWLLMEARNAPEYPEEYDAPRVRSTSGSYASELYGGYEQSSEGGLKERAGELGHRAKEKAGELTHGVRDRAGELGHRAQEGTRRLADRSRRMGGRLERMMEERPLVAGAAALIFGAAVGLLIPATSRENRLMGRSRDRLMDRARETAGEMKDVAVETAQAVKQDVRDEVRSLGQEARADAGELARQAKESAARIAEEAKETAKQKAGQRELS